MPKILDALALASMDTPAQIRRIAALWCRAHNNREPYNRVEVGKWIKQDFGRVFNEDKREKITRAIFDEARRQLRVRECRRKRALIIDPATTPAGSDIRVGRLIRDRLGPARLWVGPTRTKQQETSCYYIDGSVFSGLVAGLIPMEIRLRSISNPTLLVYRYRWDQIHTRFVSGHITTVADAFIWLIPPEAAEFLQLPGSRVEHDGDAEAVTLHTQFGSKTIPWRNLAST